MIQVALRLLYCIFSSFILSSSKAIDSTWQPWGEYSWEDFPSLYFAANPENDYTNSQLDKLAKFKLVIIEYRQSQFLGEETGTGQWADGDEGNEASIQCNLLKERCDSQNAFFCPPCLTYRSGEWSGTMYPSQKEHMQSHQELYLTSTFDCDGFTDYPLDIINEPPNDSGIERCRPDFRLQGARDFYVDTVINQNVANDPNVDGVFIDNGQSVACDNEMESSDLTFEQRRQMQRDQLVAYTDAFSILNSKGKYPILSTTNRFTSVDTPLVPWGADCPDPEEMTISAFHDAGVAFARNNEFFMWQLGATCGAQLQNALLEGQAGVPLIVHAPYFRSGEGCLEGCFNDNDERIRFDSMTKFLEFSMAAFLTVAGTGSYFGFSDMEDPNDEFGLGGWADSSWSYFPQYDIKPGPPLGNADVTNGGRRYMREFQNLNVMVDCDTGEYSLSTKTLSCDDSYFRFKVSINGRNRFKRCTWVAKTNTSSRCDLDGVSIMCARTCSTCSQCSDSFSRMKFEFNGKRIARNCRWVSKRAKNRCKIPGMQLACRQTCGMC